VTGPETHERYAELAAGHALAALEPDDEQVFRAHLAGCDDCQRALAEHHETLAHLAYAAEPVDLPDGPLEGIRRGMQDSGRLKPEPTAQAGPADLAQPVDVAAARERRRSGASGPRAWMGIAAAAALVFGLGVWNIGLRHDRSMTEQRAQRVAAAVQSLGTAGAHAVPLRDDKGRQVAIAVVRDGSVSLVVDGLAPNDEAASTYVLWQKGQYGVVSAVGTFDVRGNGVDVVRDMKMTPVAGGMAGLAVTREPGRRAPALPGSVPVADGTMTA
jgi:anti-sigma factor RsiW